MARLHHFCSALPREEYVDTRPVFTFELLEDANLRRATVLLPNSLDTSLRVFRGKSFWKTERQAKKDAAYVAYVALYHAGLVNDNLMPTVKLPSLPDVDLEKRTPKVMVNATMDPWTIMNRSWPAGKLYGSRITITQADQPYLELYGIFPEATPEFSKLMLHWDGDTSYKLTFSQPIPLLAYPPFLDLARKANKAILEAIHFSKMSKREDITCLFVPSLSVIDLEKWIQENTGVIAAKEMVQVSARTLCRNSEFHGSRFLFDSWHDDTISVTGVPRRRNFLQPPSSRRDREKDIKKLELPVEGTVFSRMPLSYITFAILVPSIMHHMEKEFITVNLKPRLLGIENASLSQITPAITSSSASSIQNYQVLEIIGDSVLKFLVSKYLFFKQTKWHEGYLSYIKGNIVSNARLCRAAREMGLDRYIMTDQFSPRKWRPPYIEAVKDEQDTEAEQETGQRSMSTKILADVVESLIGVAYLNGGLSSASRCIANFLTELSDFDKHTQIDKSIKRDC
jgi:dsRNA-specific ribonuclease